MAEICRRLNTEHGQESPQEVYDQMLLGDNQGENSASI
jgi:hypothetical protein